MLLETGRIYWARCITCAQATGQPERCGWPKKDYRDGWAVAHSCGTHIVEMWDGPDPTRNYPVPFSLN